jgi:hypothetical protein
MAHDVKFNEIILYHQLLKNSNQPRIILQPAEEFPNATPSPMIPSDAKPCKYIDLPAMKTFQSIELPTMGRIVHFDDSDDDSFLSPPETRASTLTMAPPNNRMV